MNKMDPEEEEEDEDGNPIKRDKTREEAASAKSNVNKSSQVSPCFLDQDQIALDLKFVL